MIVPHLFPDQASIASAALEVTILDRAIPALDTLGDAERRAVHRALRVLAAGGEVGDPRRLSLPARGEVLAVHVAPRLLAIVRVSREDGCVELMDLFRPEVFAAFTPGGEGGRPRR
jgi:hypothetical protein